jgi:hypothetical protein
MRSNSVSPCLLVEAPWLDLSKKRTRGHGDKGNAVE